MMGNKINEVAHTPLTLEQWIKVQEQLTGIVKPLVLNPDEVRKLIRFFGATLRESQKTKGMK